MGWSFRHPDFGLAFRLDEHGGQKEVVHEHLYMDCVRRLDAAIAGIVAEPQYREIFLDYSPPGTR